MQIDTLHIVFSSGVPQPYLIFTTFFKLFPSFYYIKSLGEMDKQVLPYFSIETKTYVKPEGFSYISYFEP
jgi:hypothetical protein